MPRYCVSMIALEKGEHIVHRNDRDCTLAPAENARQELGRLANDDEAIREAMLRYEEVDSCPECMPENNDSSDADAINSAVAAMITVSNM